MEKGTVRVDVDILKIGKEHSGGPDSTEGKENFFPYPRGRIHELQFRDDTEPRDSKPPDSGAIEVKSDPVTCTKGSHK